MVEVILKKEFDSWWSDQLSKTIEWEGIDKEFLHLRLGKEELKVRYPALYPNSLPDQRFYLETYPPPSTLHSLNESLLSSSVTSLNNVLAEIEKLITKSKSSSAPMPSCGEAESDDDGDDGGSFVEDSDIDDGDDDWVDGMADSDGEVEEGSNEDDMNDDLGHDLSLLRLKRKWEVKEKELREAEQKGLDEDSVGIGNKSDDVVQVFSDRAAFGILANDLINIMEKSEELGFSAEAVDDNIYDWVVRMNFGPETAIGSDLRSVSSTFGYDFVELSVKFKMDLYPFYPPLVRVLRPRFLGFIMGRITGLEFLRLSYWNPARDMTYVLGEIKKFILEYARVDVKSGLNVEKQGGYSRLEYLLTQLGLVSETDPRASVKYPQPTRTTLQKIKPPSNSDESKDQKTAWAKGTGYGNGDCHGNRQAKWSFQAYWAAQKEKDKQLNVVLEGIVKELQNTKNFDESAMLFLEESAFVPFLLQYVGNDSLLELDRHLNTSLTVFKIIREMTKISYLAPLLGQLSYASTSIEKELKKLNKSASLMVKIQGKGPVEEPEQEPEFTDLPSSKKGRKKDGKKDSKKDRKKEKDAKNKKGEKKKSGSTKLSKVKGSGSQLPVTIVDLYGVVVKALEKYKNVPLPAGASPECEKKEAKEDDEKDNQTVTREKYMAALEELQFDTFPTQVSGVFKHHYGNLLNTSVSNMMRLGQEQSSLGSSLPLTWDSSVFVRVDDSHPHMMTILITGPIDTPYADGCFVFDLSFPARYPSAPPLVNLHTTGHGAVRFNPNLYHCGKVCLSLLGTWFGEASEGWDPTTSTVLQVLVSIQSLILVPEPYFNEPGFESSMGTPSGTTISRSYNEVIRRGTVRWAILDQLKNPFPGFEDVIRTHFYFKRDDILKRTQEWIDDSGKDCQDLASYLKELSTLLGKLEPPELDDE